MVEVQKKAPAKSTFKPMYPAAPKPTTMETKATATVADKKAEHEAHDMVAKVNTRLAKEGSSERMQVQMRAGKPHFWWINEVPIRELTADEKAALDAMS